MTPQLCPSLLALPQGSGSPPSGPSVPWVSRPLPLPSVGSDVRALERPLARLLHLAVSRVGMGSSGLLAAQEVPLASVSQS